MKFKWPWKKDLVEQNIIVVPKYYSVLKVRYNDNRIDSWNITSEYPIDKDCWKDFFDWFNITSEREKDYRETASFTMRVTDGSNTFFFKNIYSIEVRTHGESSSGFTIK